MTGTHTDLSHEAPSGRADPLLGLEGDEHTVLKGQFRFVGLASASFEASSKSPSGSPAGRGSAFAKVVAAALTSFVAGGILCVVAGAPVYVTLCGPLGLFLLVLFTGLYATRHQGKSDTGPQERRSRRGQRGFIDSP